jgi:hypothetical protein
MKVRYTQMMNHLRVDDGYDPYIVALRDGQLPVQVYDQSCDPWACGEQLVDVTRDLPAGPRWGQGWTVLDLAGTERWLASNWDSSD